MNHRELERTLKRGIKVFAKQKDVVIDSAGIDYKVVRNKIVLDHRRCNNGKAYICLLVGNIIGATVRKQVGYVEQFAKIFDLTIGQADRIESGFMDNRLNEPQMPNDKLYMIGYNIAQDLIQEGIMLD
jgi:hypothetical protein